MEQFEEVSLKRLAEILLKKAGIIIALTLIAGIIAFVYSEMMIVPEYESSVSLYVNNDIEETVGTRVNSGDIQASQMLVDTYIVFVKSNKVLNKVSSELYDKHNLLYSADMLRECISASSVDATEVFEVTVRDTDQEKTKLIANTIADVAPEIIQNLIDGSSVKVVDHAVLGVRVAPNVQRNMVFGLLGGFLLSCLYVVLREIFDMRIKTEDELEQWFKIPILGVVPDISNTQVRKTGYYSYRRTKSTYEYKKKEVSGSAGKSNKDELVSKTQTNSK